MEQLLHGEGVKTAWLGLVEVERDGQVGADARQVLAEVSGVLAGAQVFPGLSWDLIQVRVDIIQVAVLVDQLDGCLLAHAFDARDVIRGVTEQGFVIHHLLRPDAEPGFYIFGKIIVI